MFAAGNVMPPFSKAMEQASSMASLFIIKLLISALKALVMYIISNTPVACRIAVK